VPLQRLRRAYTASFNEKCACSDLLVCVCVCDHREHISNTYLENFLGSFEKLRKMAVSFVLLVPVSCLSVEQLGFQWTDFHRI